MSPSNLELALFGSWKIPSMPFTIKSSILNTAKEGPFYLRSLTFPESALSKGLHCKFSSYLTVCGPGYRALMGRLQNREESCMGSE